VRAGEVVNLGVLRLETVADAADVFWGRARGLKKSITGMKPEVRGKMREEFPSLSRLQSSGA
jgi:hypothetical protein